MKTLFLVAWLVSAAICDGKPYGYSVAFADGVLPDAEARSVGLRLHIQGAYAVVLADLPEDWTAQVIRDEDEKLTVTLSIWNDTEEAISATNERCAVPARDLLRCIWIQALPVTYDEESNEPPPALLPGITGHVGLVRERSDVRLLQESFDLEFGVRRRPSWSDGNDKKKNAAEPCATDNPDDAQRSREDH